MRIVKLRPNHMGVILSLREMKTIDFLTNSGQMVHFADAREFIEMSLLKAIEYLEHYEGVANHGDRIA